jgi:hypothetical protein
MKSILFMWLPVSLTCVLPPFYTRSVSPLNPYPSECLRLSPPCSLQVNFRRCTVIATNYGRARSIEQSRTHIVTTIKRMQTVWRTQNCSVRRLLHKHGWLRQYCDVSCCYNCQAVATTGMPSRRQETVTWVECNEQATLRSRDNAKARCPCFPQPCTGTNHHPPSAQHHFAFLSPQHPYNCIQLCRISATDIRHLMRLTLYICMYIILQTGTHNILSEPTRTQHES